MANHYWTIETSGLTRRRAEAVYRLFHLAVRMLGGEVVGGYGDVAPVETVPARDVIEAEASKMACYHSGYTGRKVARIKWARTILGLSLSDAKEWVEENFPDTERRS